MHIWEHPGVNTHKQICAWLAMECHGLYATRDDVEVVVLLVAKDNFTCTKELQALCTVYVEFDLYSTCKLVITFKKIEEEGDLSAAEDLRFLLFDFKEIAISGKF